MVARLIEDGGASASEPDFFRSPGFLAAEKATHSLLVTGAEGEEVAATPLLVREINGTGHRDAISPYGYPGLAIRPGIPPATLPLNPAAIDFGETGLVTIFLRHALGRDLPFRGTTERNLCLLSDPALPRKSRMSDRQQIRKNLKRGYLMETTAGPETSDDLRTGFFNAYTETMRRTEATDRYFFSRDYFNLLLDSESTWLVLARDADSRIAAGSIAALSDGLLHYYLSGTADSHLRDSPMKNVIEAMIEFGAERHLPVSFGGGMTPGDALETFKRGFANREEHFHTSEIICDPGLADQLLAARNDRIENPPLPGFFPAYRAPGAPA